MQVVLGVGDVHVMMIIQFHRARSARSLRQCNAENARRRKSINKSTSCIKVHKSQKHV